MLLGCIADDFTGATDLAGMLVRGGLRVVQTVGVPNGSAEFEADAVVVALKSRTCPVVEAVADSLAALEWLRSKGARQIYFKYCSTFDSTPEGNIGPVAEALLDALGASLTVFCPALPVNGRTVFQGHLFVGRTLLNESGMAHHPLTPMTDPNLVRVLAAQVDGGVGLVDHVAVRAGVGAVRARLDALTREGARMAVVDTVDDGDFQTIGEVVADLPLVTGGSGLALGLPEAYRRRGWLDGGVGARTRGGSVFPSLAAHAPAAVLAGSCSPATRAQVATMATSRPHYCLDPMRLSREPAALDGACQWARRHLEQGPVLLYSSTDPCSVEAAQALLGAAQAGELIEHAFAEIARELVAGGVQRLIVAGGETSGAVVGALGIEVLRIGPEIDPGVPWTSAVREAGAAPLALALKSGNFGSPEFFEKAFRVLDDALAGAGQ